MTASPNWDPAQYGLFADHRVRPSLDMVARIGIDDPATIVDLGCGAGNVTRLLHRRWPNARVVGMDNSPEMLRAARDAGGDGIAWRETDIAAWRPDGEDLVFSSAALQWIDGHEVFFREVADALHPGAMLAVQMPDNFDAPSHQIMREIARDPAWRDRLAEPAERMPVHPARVYDRWLSPIVSMLDIWHATYQQVLTGADPVLEWVKGTGMRAYFDRLEESERRLFEERCRAALAEAYPPDSRGRTLFPFRRLFIVATK